MPEYDPTRDLATLLHAAVRQGSWGPAVRGALDRLERELGLTSHCLASDIEETLRLRGSAAARRAAALANVEYLASLSGEQLHEAVLFFEYEHPGKAARLRQLLTGQAVPRHLEQAAGE